MSRNRGQMPPQPPPSDGVPVIGGKHFVNVCGRGHAELATGPFTFDVPTNDGRVLKVPVCRACMVNFFGTWFNVSTVNAAEFEASGGVLNDGGIYNGGQAPQNGEGDAKGEA